MNVFGQKWWYLGKVVVFGQKCLYSDRNGYIRQKWLYSDIVVKLGISVVFGQK